MPAAKVYIIDELENLKGHCRERKQKQNVTSVHISDNECSSIIAKKAAPKYVLRMMSSINLTNVFGESNSTDEKDDFDNILINQEETEEEKNHVENSPATQSMSVAVEETAKKFVGTIQSAEYIEHVADKLTCKKVDMEGLIKNKEVKENTIDRKFSVHEHIKLKNESPAFRYLSHYFGSGSSVRLPLGNEFPQTLKVAEGRKPEKTRKKRHSSEKQNANGMVIFINPDFAFGDTVTLTVSGILPRPRSEQHLEATTATYTTTFWSNGDTNGLELTCRHNLTGGLSTFGGVVPAMEGRNRRKSIPGWNGRAPMWVPFNECECTISRSWSTHATIKHHNSQEEGEEREGEPQACSRLGGTQTSQNNSTFNFQNTFATGFDSTSPPLSLSCAEASPYDTRRPDSSFGIRSSSRMRGDGAVVYVTVFACKSSEVAIDKLSILSRKYQKKVTSSTTFRGDMPALSMACLHGNIIAVRKLLKAGADPNRVAGSTGSTPLHDAVVGGHHAVMQLLLQYRAQQTCVDDHGRTALHLCCVNNDVAGARVLLQHKDAQKALIVADTHGRTPRMSCSRSHLKDVIEREENKHGIKEKRSSSWWSNLAGAAGDRPAGMKKSTAEDFMKMAVLVAKHKKKCGAPPKSKNN